MVRTAKWILLCAVLAGCGGLQRDLVYRPSAPVPRNGQARLDREGDAAWPLVLGDAELDVREVVYSSKLVWVFGPFIAFPTFWEPYVPRPGPLQIAVSVAAKPGASIGFDLREFTVVLEDGRSLAPSGAALWGSREFEPAGPVLLSDGQTWRGRLQYDLLLTDLTPFALRPGTLDVDGEAIRPPPISFVRGKSYSGS